MKVKSLSRVRLIVTPWTAAHQAPPPVGFSRREHWSGCHRLLLSCYVSKFMAVNVDVKKSLFYQVISSQDALQKHLEFQKKASVHFSVTAKHIFHVLLLFFF